MAKKYDYEMRVRITERMRRDIKERSERNEHRFSDEVRDLLDQSLYQKVKVVAVLSDGDVGG